MNYIHKTCLVTSALRRAGRHAPRLLFPLLLAARALAAPAAVPLEFRGMCGASAAVPVAHLGFLVASDEDSVLRLYRADAPGLPVATFDLAPYLGLDRKHPETDLEGAARVGDLAYWIASHGRNADGKLRPSRQRFFATRLLEASGTGTVRVELEGTPYEHLLPDLIAEPRLRDFRLAEAATRAAKEPGGLNIEGLAATPEGQLLIGFRSPTPQGRALVVPLANPADLGRGGRARFGDPLLLDLGGRGVRDLVLHHGGYLVAAGPATGEGSHRLYRWAGPGHAPVALREPGYKNFNAEALVVFPTASATGARVLVVSDDGGRKLDGEKCKDTQDPALRRFRARWLE